jgi:hypothetical protein
MADISNNQGFKSFPPGMKLFYIVAGVLLILGCVLMTYVFLSRGNENSSGGQNLESMASVQCRNFVKDNIKSPSTAKFTTPMTTKLSDDTFEVVAYVDAENSFGAVVRNLFICRIRYEGGDDAFQSNWSLLDLTFSEP